MNVAAGSFLPKKNPCTVLIGTGMPYFILVQHADRSAFPGIAIGIECISGRFSGLPDHLTRFTFPAPKGQWHLQKLSSPVTAAGPLPILTGFPKA